MGSQHCGDGWTELEWGVRTGGLCFEKIHNAPFFEHIATVPGAEDNFLKAMHAIDSIGEACCPEQCTWLPRTYSWLLHSVPATLYQPWWFILASIVYRGRLLMLCHKA